MKLDFHNTLSVQFSQISSILMILSLLLSAIGVNPVSAANIQLRDAADNLVPKAFGSASAFAAKSSLAQWVQDTWSETFADATQIASSTNITQVTDVIGGVFGADFTPYPGNPLSTLESSDPWDSSGDARLQIPGAVHPDLQYFPNGMDGYKYWMVFTPLAFTPLPEGIPPAPDPSMQTDWWWERPTLVRSNDGIHWVKTPDYTNPLVSPGTDGDWDSHWHADPDFVYAPNKGPNGESWFLYWCGCGPSTCQNGVATSSDGKHYTKIGPVMPGWTRTPAVVFDGSSFHMWYNWGSFEIGYATSADGVNWTPYNPTNPGQWGYIVYRGTPGTYDQGGVTHEDVVYFGGQYHMYYMALPTASYAGINIGHATSPDGIHWTQYPTPAMVPGGESWRFWNTTTPTAVQSFYRPTVAVVDDTLYMYYGGTDTYVAYPTVHYDIGLALPSTPDGHVELTKDSEPAEYPTRANTLAWYHMNEGNPPPPQYPGEYTPQDTTLAWYHFSEGSGSTTADVGGPVNDTATLSGATWTPAGLYGDGLSFDGNDQVNAPNSTDLNPESGITIEAWVNPSVTKANNYIAIKMTQNTSDYAYGLKIDNGAVGGFIRNGSTLYFSYGGQVPQNTWSHVAMTYQVESTQTYVKLYLNGAEVSSYTTQNAIPANTPIASNTGPLNIGVIPVSTPVYFQGTLDEVRILGRTMTPTEIAADGNKVTVTPTLLDVSGNDNNGSPNSGVTWTDGRFSHGLQFNGTTGVVSVPHSATLNPQDGVTLEAWVNPTIARQNNYIVNKASTGIGDFAYGIKLESGYTGTSEIGGIIRDPDGQLYFAYGGSVPNGTWTHIAMTYQLGDSHIRLYQNGVEVNYRYGILGEATDTIPADTYILANTAQLNIGMLPASPLQYYFSGIMDELRIMSRALTPGEIAADYGSSYSSSGNLTSVVITPPSGQQWGEFSAADNRPQGTNIQYSILDEAGQPLMTSVTSGSSIASLSSVPIRIRAEMATDDPAQTPIIESFTLTSSAALNHAPVANDDSYLTDTGTTLTIAAPGVLENDTDADTDPLSAAKVDDPDHGTLNLNSDGSFTYTPTSGYTGDDTFTYLANDGTADSNEATVTITVVLGIVVNTNADNVTPGDGFCTLREAINNVNALGETTGGDCSAADGVDDTITFAGNYTITLGSALPNIVHSVTIIGNGAEDTIIQASTCNPVTMPGGCTRAAWRVFYINNGLTVSLNDLTVQHGYASSQGGGIYNLGTLNITRSTIAGNYAGTTSAGYGGGIYNSTGTLNISGSILSGNYAGHRGGVIENGGVLSVTDSTFIGNESDWGGAIVSAGSSSATALVTKSTFIGNYAGNRGGAINVYQGALTVANSTFSGNTGVLGGGLSNNATLTVINSTITDNTTTTASNGSLYNYGGTLTLTNSIVAGNHGAPNCYRDGGTIANGGNNIEDASACGFSGLINTDPLLGPLQDNGGPTETHALLPFSPAIDAGNNSVCSAAPVNSMDQRGVTRPQGTACDIGAYEFLQDTPNSLTVEKVVTNNNGGTAVVGDFPLFIDGTRVTNGVTNPVDPGTYTVSETSLPGYVGTFSGDCDADGNITVGAGEHKTCTLTNDDEPGTLTVQKVVINDNGGTAEVADFPLFIGITPVTSGVANPINAGTYTVSETSLPGYVGAFSGDCNADGSVTVGLGEHKTCTITNNDPAPVQCTADCYVDDADGSDANGGTSWEDAKLTIQAAVDQVDTGGTVHVAAGTYAENVTVARNMTINGAGAGVSIVDGGGVGATTNMRVFYINSGLTVYLNDMTVQHGHAEGGSNGGGIYNLGTLNIARCTIADNHSGTGTSDTGYGGGIFNSGTLNISASTFSGNYAGHRGGGIANDGVLNVTGSTFTGNEARFGGGVVASASPSVTLVTNSTFTGNHASSYGGGINVYQGTFTVANSTFSANTGGHGAGLSKLDTSATLSIINSTITNNTTTSESIFRGGGGTVTLTNSIVAGNNVAANCSGGITDGGDNLEDANDCGFSGLINTDPLLGSLQDNGGPTETHALMPGSPAINTGNEAVCVAAPVNGLDQRGVIRPQPIGGNCDIGAFEQDEFAPIAVDDTYSVDEDALLSVSAPGVLGNDTDADSDPLTAVKVDDPLHGSLDLDADGSFTYTPSTGYVGFDSFTYQANDSTENSNIATVTIQVNESTPPPPLPSRFFGEIHINDSPPHIGDTVQIFAPGVSGPVAAAAISYTDPNLVYIVAVPGDISGTPAKEGGAEGDILTFKINDRVVATGIWLSGTNVQLDIHPPEALPGSPNGSEGSAIILNGSANDWGGDANTYDWDLNNDGTYETSAEDPSQTWPQDGSYTVNLRVTDDQGGVGIATVDAIVTNIAPTVDAGGPYNETEDLPVDFTGTATDPGADTLTYEWDFDYDGSTFNMDESGSLSASHAYAVPGTFAVALRVHDDDTFTIDTATVIVSNINDAPVITEEDSADVAMSEDGSPTPFGLTLHASDPDIGDIITWSISSDATHGTATAGGTGTSTVIGYAPSTNYNGIDSFIVQISDGNGGLDTITVNVTINSINDVPTISNILNQATLINVPTGNIPFTVGDVETPVASLTVTATSNNQSLVPDANITLGGGGGGRTIQITPAANQTGTATITVTVNDGTDTTSDTFLLTVWPAVLYAAPGGITSGICDSWGNACELRYAMRNSISGQEIWASAGVYKPTSGTDRTATFTLKSGVGLYGGFAGTETARTQRDWDTNATILSGDIDNNDINIDGNFIAETIDDIQGANSYHVVTGSGTDNTAVLDGCIVTAAETLLSFGSSDAQGGGMYNASGSPTISHLTFSGNSGGWGAGMYNNNGNPLLTDVTFIGNAGHWDTSYGWGGGMFNHTSSPVLNDVRFINNSVYQDGGAMYNSSGSSPQLTDVSFIGNSAHGGAGIVNTGGSSPILTNVTFLGNTADSAAGIYNVDGSSPTLTNVLFSGNTAVRDSYYDSAAIGNARNSNPVLTNVTFSHNSGGNAVIVNTENSTPVMVNSIIRDSGLTVSGMIYNDGTSSTTVTYSNLEGGYAGTGNLDTLPLFADADGADNVYGTADDDLRLLPGSPAIDAGTDTGCPATDLRGLGRVGTCDMGAFEAQGFTLSITGGNNQSAYRNDAFADPLQVSIAPDVIGEPVDGGQITFTAPVSGASATITGSPATIVGGAASVTAAANGVLGAYQVTANASGANPVAFDLANINHIPTISDIPNQTTDEDTATGDIAFTVGDLDAGDVLQVSATSSNQTLVPDANITLGGGGGGRTINILPAANQHGTATITVTVSDGVDQASDTFVLTVVDLLPTNANAGGPYNAIAGQSIILQGSADCPSVDTCTYNWDLDGDGDYDDATGTTPTYTWNTVGNYTIGLRVTDDNTNAITDTASVVISGETHSIGLVPGWNLVSFNVKPTNPAIASVLSSINGNYDLVYAWDASIANNNWKKYSPTAPGYSNTLSALNETMGFWIHMTAADSLDVTGSVPVTTAIGLSINAGGWNLVGYPSMANRPLPQALSDNGAGTDFSLVYAYHASETADPWKLFGLASPGWANDLTELSPGWGYWVKVSANHIWSVKYLAGP